ncbi:MAG: stage II sporulation protein M [Chitinophagaceae bacterium]|nr:stage II sporulation protein M [Chitinophagaceae bacterium]
MREALFIKKNKDRWLRIQSKPSSDPDELAADFIQLVDDLAYAKTFYPSGQVTKFINTQASRSYLDIYKNRKEEHNRLWRFWKYDLPLTIRKHYKVMLFALAVFVVFFAVGFFASEEDPGVAREFFGDGYVEETNRNIRDKNPFGIYETGNSFFVWLGIMTNNIAVALRIFASGIVLGVPAIYEAAKNGAMVGVFDQMFAAHGLGLDFWMVVFVHGTLEITAIILACGAGIIMGKSFLFPGTISRLQSLKEGAKDGVKILVGLLPIFALAAFFEGFITRLYNDLSLLTTLVFLLSVLFVIWYFIIYPILLGRKMALSQTEEEI